MTSSTMTERTIRVNGKQIYLAEKGSGTPVVLLHGGGPGHRECRTTPATSMLWPNTFA